MTKEQRNRARQKAKLRTNKILETLEWLCENNYEWKSRNIDLENITHNLKNPTLVDNSREVDGSESNIEAKESFQVFFPDGTMDSVNCGQDDIESFKELVQQAKQAGFDLQFQADLSKSIVSDYKNNNLVKACLLQFPFGRGGLEEERYNNDQDDFDYKPVTLEEYIQHLSGISNPVFHNELFVLILYNMKMKLEMVRSACWRVREKGSAEFFTRELTENDIDAAINLKKDNSPAVGNSGPARFIKAIDAISRNIPHTNEAARKARRTGECFQHHFGTQTHFLTVTPDDDNSLLVQIYSNTDIDLSTVDVDSMTDSEIRERCQKRKELRIKIPGICAFVFEMVLEIVIEEVIGWNLKRNKAKSSGFFGRCKAFIATIEEQGRRTLHSHISFWIDDISKARESLFSRSRKRRRSAKKYLAKEIDRTSSTAFMFSHEESRSPVEVFDHDCQKRKKSRKQPEVVNDQKLRDLRYKSGNNVTGDMFAYCPHCTSSWCYEDLVRLYLHNGVEDVGFIRSGVIANSQTE